MDFVYTCVSINLILLILQEMKGRKKAIMKGKGLT